MKDISIYFEPVGEALTQQENGIDSVILKHDKEGFPELSEAGVALVYVPENRGRGGYSQNNEDFRKEFYKLNVGDNWSGQLYDLGTIQPGENIKDTYFAVSQVVAELIKSDIIPIIIGGGQDLTLACYKGFEELERTINICAIDNSLDVGEPNGEVASNGYVSHMLMQRPCYLFNYANIGLQRPLVSNSEMDLFDKLYFDICRLGAFNQDFKLAEPYLRNSDLISIDFTSLKASESDVNAYSQANGFRADQICQIARYAGISDKMSCLGIFNVNPEQNNLASNLLAQIIWYFIDGVSERVGDFPIGTKKGYTKFYVHLEDFQDDLVFYKSDKSNRWWLEVSYPPTSGSKYERHHLIPCNQEDYNDALQNKIPNLWWKTLQKLS